MGKITVIGLGPGDFGLITMECYELMLNAKTLLFRTAIHPTVEKIREKGIKFSSYDSYYEKAENFESLYKSIAENLLELAETGQEIVYAVPGSPMVAEKTVVLLRQLVAEYNEKHENKIELDIKPGMSFAEIMYCKLGIDPIEGTTIIDAEDFAKMPIDNPTGLIITQVYSPAIASDLKLALMEAFSDEYEITYVHKLGMPDERIVKIPLFELDRQPDIDYLTSLYVPPMLRQPRFDMTPLQDIIATLRSPGGCPWDIAQTHESIRQNLIEEAYEVLEAIDLEDYDLLCEELGDLLMQVIFHARMSEEVGEFSMQDVVDRTTEKLVRRHPHVFGDIQASDAGAALLSWEQVKQVEKSYRKSKLDGIPKDLPSLMYAQKMQHKAAKVGFDWDNIEPVWDKLNEEIKELKEAVQQEENSHIEEELGDLLFTVVNISRFLKVDSEVALRGCSNKFRTRFLYVEECVNNAGGDWSKFSLDDLDNFWNEAKKLENEKNEK